MTDPDTDTPRNTLRAPEFWLLFIAALAAGFGVSGWITIPATMAGLLISSLPKYVALYPRAVAVRADVAFWATVLASTLHAAVAAIATFVLGRATWWLWGL